MDRQMDLAALSRQQVDPEVFRRVWARVMPDQESSPIQVDPPGAVRPPAPAPARREAPPASDREILRGRIAQTREGVQRLQTLLRRTGGRQGTRVLSGLLDSLRQTVRQLSADYFLAAGERYQPAGGGPAVHQDFALALREQFLWAQAWTRDSLQAARQCGDDHLRDLFGQLARGGEFHARAIRSLLERMQ